MSQSNEDDPRKVIERLAYKLWQEAGEPPNCAWHFWFEAERQLEQTTGSGDSTPERRLRYFGMPGVGR